MNEMKLNKDGSIATIIKLLCIKEFEGFTVGKNYEVEMKDKKKFVVYNDNETVVTLTRNMIAHSGIFAIHQYAYVMGKDWPSPLYLQLLSADTLNDTSTVFMFKETTDTVDFDGNTPSREEEQVLLCYHVKGQEVVSGFWLSDGKELSAVTNVIEQGRLRMQALASCGLT